MTQEALDQTYTRRPRKKWLTADNLTWAILLTMLALCCVCAGTIYFYPRFGYDWAVSKVIPPPPNSTLIFQTTKTAQYNYTETFRVYSVSGSLVETFQWLVSQGGIYFYEKPEANATSFHSTLIDPFKRTEFFLLIGAGNISGLWEVDVLPSSCFEVEMYMNANVVTSRFGIPPSQLPVDKRIMITKACGNW
ncbi:MAG: hypothetical protein KF716_15350 [Anaerolineae bacterium]|nr:hypothetical protein [Anaerolineae bacterium]